MKVANGLGWLSLRRPLGVESASIAEIAVTARAVHADEPILNRLKLWPLRRLGFLLVKLPVQALERRYRDGDETHL